MIGQKDAQDQLSTFSGKSFAALCVHDCQLKTFEPESPIPGSKSRMDAANARLQTTHVSRRKLLKITVLHLKPQKILDSANSL